MMRELFEFIGKHRIAACLAVVIIALECAGAIYLYTFISPGPAQATPTPTPTPTVTDTPTAVPSPSPTPTPEPSPTPVPAATVTPDMAITRSISSLDQYAPNYMVQVNPSMDTGLLSIDLTKSDTGGQYAYRNDTYTVRLALMDTSSNASIDRIRIQASCVNGSGNGYSLYQDDRVDYVLLKKPGDWVVRTVGFTVAPGTPTGLYKVRVVVSADLAGNDTWADHGCTYESGLNILPDPR